MIDFTKPQSLGQTLGPAHSPQLLALEAERKVGLRRAVKIVLLTALIALTPGVIMVCTLSGKAQELSVAAFVLAGVAVLFSFFAASNSFDGYRAHFKQQIIAPLVQSLDRGLTLAVGQGLEQEHYDASLLFTTCAPCARYKAEDLITGTVGGMAVRFSEVFAESRHTRRSKNGNQTSYRPIFSGVLMVAEGAAAAATVVVLPSRETKADQRLTDVKLPEVATGDQAFAGVFRVYAADAAQAAALLTADVRSRLLAAAAKRKQPPRLAVAGGRLYVAAPMAANLFEPPFVTSLLNEDVRRYAAQVKTYAGLIEELGVRSWVQNGSPAAR